ncbi:MAG: hypothetical protein KGL19_01535 [Bacteroidota bacterium]|nr:hypothetical protein [Bacteroidota bacterium]
MKRGIFISIIALSIAIISTFVFIPSKITVSTVRYINAYHGTILKFQADNKALGNWLQTISTKTANGYRYKGFDYNIDKTVSNITEINVKSEKLDLKSSFISLNIYLDSSAIQWAAEIESGLNPLVRLNRYREAIRLKESMSDIMDQMKIFLDNSTNMYGILVKETQLKDSVLITVKMQTAKYPSVEEIYSQANKLSDYAISKNASVTNYPMLFVNKIDNAHYETMIGLPINKIIEQTSDIRIKRMPYNGNIFVTEIKGGPQIIQRSFQELNTYLFDSKRVSPAIPFEMMITDRLKEPDTTKWITKLYYPVM